MPAFSAINSTTLIGTQVAAVDLTGQAAAITSATLFAVATSGFYVVHWVATVTRAATTSSILGGTKGFQLSYTDVDDSVSKIFTPTSGVVVNNNNTTSQSISGTQCGYCKSGNNLLYNMDYTSVGGTTMQYNLHIRAYLR